MTLACFAFHHNRYEKLIQMLPNQKYVQHFVAESENFTWHIILLQFVSWDSQLASTCVGRRNKDKLQTFFFFFSQMDEIRALSSIESLLSDIGEICIMETLHRRGSKDVPFQQHCLLRDKLRPHSCVFSISFIWAIQSVSSLSPSVSPPRPLVCMCAYMSPLWEWKSRK